MIWPLRLGHTEADRHHVEEGGLWQGEPGAAETLADVEAKFVGRDRHRTTVTDSPPTITREG